MTDVSNNRLQYCVLDDEETFLDIAQQRLEQLLPDIPGRFISNPEKAIEIARENHKTLFLLDINLGTTDGIDIYNRLRDISAMISVIFTTGDSTLIDTGIRTKALSEGGIDFVEKPIKWHEFTIKVKNHLNIMAYRFELEQKVRERTRMLIHADRLATVGTMVSSVVHEITSPLTFIKANTEQALKSIGSALDETDSSQTSSRTVIPCLEDCMKGIADIERLLISFREFYKQEDSSTAVHWTSLADAVSEARNIVFHRLKKHMIDCRYNIETNPDVTIQIRRAELVQILTNIMNNAVDALETNEPGDRILVISAENSNGRANVHIGNNGPSIPNDVVERVFDPFFTTRSNTLGTGLGLSIVRQILERSNAAISVDNRDTEDMVVFRISFPTTAQGAKS